MAKKKKKGMTINEYLNSLSEEERLKIKPQGPHNGATMGLMNAFASMTSQALDEALKQRDELEALVEILEAVTPLAEKGSQFSKTPQRQREIAQKGGHEKFSKGYNRFLEWVDKTGFDVKSHEGDSNVNFANALLHFKLNGKKISLKLSEKTADKYRKKFLSDLSK